MIARPKLAEILRIERRAQFGWTLVMTLGGLATACLFAGLPVYAWARVRLLRIQLAAGGIALAPRSALVGVLYAIGLVGGVAVAMAGAAAGGQLERALEAPAIGPVAGLMAALALYAALLGPLARLPLILLDARRVGTFVDALGASLGFRERGGFDLATTAMALSFVPLLVMMALEEGQPQLSALALAAPWLGMALASALRVADYAAAEPPEAVTAALPRGLGALTGLAAVLAAALCLTVFVPAPMRPEAAVPTGTSTRSLPVGLGGEGVELRAAEGGLLVLRMDGGGAGRIASRTGLTGEDVHLERLPDGRGHRVHVATEGGYEYFEVDERGVRRDDRPIDRTGALLGGAGSLLFFLSLFAATLALRFPVRRAVLDAALPGEWGARGAMLLTATLMSLSFAHLVRALL